MPQNYNNFSTFPLFQKKKLKNCSLQSSAQQSRISHIWLATGSLGTFRSSLLISLHLNNGSKAFLDTELLTSQAHLLKKALACMEPGIGS
jgi:hypothetical protein